MKKIKVAASAIAFGLMLGFQACENNLEDHIRQDTSSTAAVSALSQAEFIPGRYIVVLRKDRVPLNAHAADTFEQRRAKARAVGRAILKEKGIPEQALSSAYGFALVGFAAGLTPEQVQVLRSDPRVAYIEQDQVVRLIDPIVNGSSSTSATATSTQTVPIGITRVGGPSASLEPAPGSTYTGKRAYVIDTGILLFTNASGNLITHPDLNVETNRAKMYNAFCDDFIDGKLVTCPDSDRYPNDGNGHGTHVAGTIGARNNTEGVVGVAPGVRVVAVKVLGTNGTGTNENVLEGLDFVYFDSQPLDVANMSLGASASDAMDEAVVKVATDKQVFFAIAAGNDGMPAGSYSPARVAHARVYTVAAISTKISRTGSWTDRWASFSNYGQPPIDFVAPGVDVRSTYVNVVTKADGTKSYEPAYATLSGTSMAAPHVGGLLILNGNSSGGNIMTDGTVSRITKDVYKIAHR